MFALKFDDLMRKALAHPTNPVYLKKLVTAMPGTPDYEAYMGLFLLPENDTVEILLEDDRTATFYTIITDPKFIKTEREAYYERIRAAELARRSDPANV